MKDDDIKPDFAMMRAVEVLAGIYERQVKNAEAPPPPLDKPLVLFNETISFDVTRTTKADVEKALGLAFAYPSAGWHTYCVLGSERGEREFLSIFYSEGKLASVELYVPRADRAPRLEARNLGRFRFVPAEIMLGMQITALPENFGRIMAPDERAAYSDIFEARFPGGAGYAMANNGIIERLALYVLKGT